MRRSLPKASSKRPDWLPYLTARVDDARHAGLQRYYSRSLFAPETPIANIPMVALDMETTGLDERRHAIVSIGLVPFDMQRIRLAERRYWVVKPPRPLNRDSVTFHHITHSEIADAPDLREILDELLDALAGRLIVVHYRNIERHFLNTAVNARIGEEFKFPVIDTMELEARLHRRTYLSRLKRRLGGKPVSIRLHNSRGRYGLPAYQSHHAVIDSLATAELLQAQVARHYSLETPLADIWI
ncbi:3'-5' exonuclease [Aidingimonas lacisalsi]|uniref:3'-5' exonuclease n=1 Tax=Aidingimonas lacisalsi TaxID=2604086 RepID=UPI0011D2876D|nr:3'-5' exonuclease [Aidingimonas lacisalsi]